MPIYSYNCKSCKAEFDKLVMSADLRDDMNCIYCNSKKTDRHVSSPNVCCQTEPSVSSNCVKPSGFG